MKEQRKKISILGCGWLGFPLAKKIIEIGYEVKGSTTSESKLENLKANNIQPFQIKLSENEINGNIEEFLADSEIVIINIPPKLRSNSKENFVEKIKLLMEHIEKSTVKNVLFVSSTSVFADVFPIVEIDENSIPNPDSESGKQLLQTEELLLSNPNFQTTILRFGGLIGDDRHPIKFLAGKQNVENPDAPINFIHQYDCIGVIEAILKHLNNSVLKENQIFNAVANNHPNRAAYYHKIAKKENLPLPIFAKNTVSKGKIISNLKVKTILSYAFKMEN